MKKLMIALLLATATSAAFAAADPAQGQKAFHNCVACHSPAQGANSVGPSLFGIVGRKAGSVPGLAYSRAMKTSNLSWTAQNLDAYIADPQKLVPGNHMAYSGLPDAQERAALIAYLQSLH
jgi:cytochrome c